MLEAFSRLGQCYDTINDRISSAINAIQLTAIIPTSEHDLREIFWRDVQIILLPTLSARLAGDAIANFSSTPALMIRSLRRIELMESNLLCWLTDDWLQSFLVKLHPHAVLQPIRIAALSADTHSGAKRPMLIASGSRQFVLKTSDPAPSAILRSVTNAVEQHFNIALLTPEIYVHPNNKFYLSDFVDVQDQLSSPAEEKAFAERLGVVLGIAYGLRMIDIHIENLMVWSKTPVIVDPECILYHYPGVSNDDRLINTGIIGPAPHLTSMRGGDKVLHSAEPVLSNGVVRFQKPMRDFKNRPRTSNGHLFNPIQHYIEIVSAFRRCCNWFKEHQHSVEVICASHIKAGTRLRYLVRKTRHYSHILHALNIPMAANHSYWCEHILHLFRKSSGFTEVITSEMVGAELAQIYAGDIPYFWSDGELGGLHWAGGCIQQELPAVRGRLSEILALEPEGVIQRSVEQLTLFLTADGVPYYE